MPLVLGMPTPGEAIPAGVMDSARVSVNNYDEAAARIRQ
jgi:hypothetical protein